jgi:DNA-directed RNA polymerase subunit RPC12/RpoP
MKTFQEWVNIHEGRKVNNRKLYNCPHCHEKSAYVNNDNDSFNYACFQCGKEWSEPKHEPSNNAGVSGRQVTNRKKL